MSPFAELTDYLDSLPQRYHIPGCDCVITHRGRAIYRHSAGFSDLAGTRPVSSRDTYWIYSATKLFTCTAALRLWDQGKLHLEDPVSLHLPEYEHLTVRDADGTVRPMAAVPTVAQLMSMTGGLDYDLQRPGILAVQKLPPEEQTTRRFAAALAADPWCFDPGTHFQYSLCHDVLGAVIEAASGQSLHDYIRCAITEPLGMTDTTFHPSQEQLSRASAQFVHLDPQGRLAPCGSENSYRLSERYDSGGAGLMSTVDDYIRLLSALSMGGVSAEGYRLLSARAIETLAANRLTDAQLAEFRFRPAFAGYGYGLGVRTAVDSALTGSFPGEFGWDGAAGAYTMVDPMHQTALYYAQQVLNSDRTYNEIHPTVRALACREWAGLF